MAIRILIVDDHKIMCDGLKSLIDRHDGMEVIGTTTNGRDAVSLTLELKPDIVIMDVLIPEFDGIEASKKILEKSPETKIIALSMYSHKHYLTAMLEAGVAGYVVKGCSFDELVSAITSVHSGGTYLSDEIAKTVIKGYVNTMSHQKTIGELLTEKECAVLKLIADGKKTKAIADEMDISVKTVETYRRQLMQKLEIETVADLVKYAIKEGFTSISE
ncbi:MAG: response regulator transcription factor [Spirochaetales bacterium]|nr:response regulator transcription factor [Spirochaetales bacterium]